MKRIIGEHFKHNGMPKRSFAKINEAKEFARLNHGNQPTVTYKCSFCGNYHNAKA